jgi:hypothetical protein
MTAKHRSLMEGIQSEGNGGAVEIFSISRNYSYEDYSQRDRVYHR